MTKKIRDQILRLIPKTGISEAETQRQSKYSLPTVRKYLKQLVEDGIIWKEYPPHKFTRNHMGNPRKVSNKIILYMRYK